MNRKLYDAEITKPIVWNSYENAEGIISNRKAAISSFNIQFRDEGRKREDLKLSYYLISISYYLISH